MCPTPTPICYNILRKRLEGWSPNLGRLDRKHSWHVGTRLRAHWSSPRDLRRGVIAWSHGDQGSKARISADRETEESRALGVDGGNTWHRCLPLKANVQMLWRAGTLQGAQELLTRAVYVAWTQDRPESLSMKKITVLSYLTEGASQQPEKHPQNTRWHL